MYNIYSDLTRPHKAPPTYIVRCVEANIAANIYIYLRDKSKGTDCDVCTMCYFLQMSMYGVFESIVSIS